MNATDVLLVLLAILLSGVLVYYQYGYKQQVNRDTLWFSLLRFLSWVGILLLLLDPEIDQRYTEVEKPGLVLALDNSSSMVHLGTERTVRELRDSIMEDKELNERFDLRVYSFSNGLSADTVLAFEGRNTNIDKTIRDANALGRDRRSPIVIVTDGNQTFGNNYAYSNSKNPVFAFAVGDTVRRQDLQIDRINVNSYAALHNNFPVEIFLTSEVSDNKNATLTVERKGDVVYRTSVGFSPADKSERVSLLLPADSTGMQLYKVSLQAFRGERNTSNNTKSFGVEIIDEKAEVVVVYSLLHPDLGMIKRSIESNGQSKVILIPIEEFDKGNRDYSIYALYQPDRSFGPLIRELTEAKKNILVFTGSRTDWTYLNQAGLGFTKSPGEFEEKVFPAYQIGFSSFHTEDFGFDQLPPLGARLGEVKFTGDSDLLLTFKVNGIETRMALVSVYSHGEAKGVLWSGEGFWQWRAACYDRFGSFDKFDDFFNSLIQFLHLSDRERNLELEYKNVFHANDPVIVRARKYDSNLNADVGSELVLKFKDSTVEEPFYARDGFYELQLDDLEPGTYDFEVRDLDSEQRKNGSFMVVPFSIEQEMSGVNIDDLRLLATNSGGNLYFPDQLVQLKNQLLENEQFKAVETERSKMISLIDWKWLLGLIVLSLSLEWLLRKYRGLI